MSDVPLTEKQHSFAYAFVPLFLVLVIDTMGIGIVLPILSTIFMGKGPHAILSPDTPLLLRTFWYGMSLGCFFLFMLFGAAVLGDLSDKVGRRRVLLLGLGGVALGYFMSALGVYVHSLFLLIAGRCLCGLMAGSQPIAQAAIIDVSTPENKARHLGLITLANCLGFVVGPILGGLLSHAEHFAWFTSVTPFVFAGILAVLNAVALCFTFKETVVITEKPNFHLLKGLSLFIDAFRHKNLRVFALVMLFMQLAWGTYFQFISLFFVERFHYTSWQVGVFMTFLGILFTLALTLIVRVIVNYELKKVTLCALVGASIGMLFPTLFPTELSLWLSTVLITMSAALVYTCGLTVFSNMVDASRQGWVMGICSSVISVAWFFDGILVGLTGELTHFSPFAVALLSFILSALTMLFFIRRT